MYRSPKYSKYTLYSIDTVAQPMRSMRMHARGRTSCANEGGIRGGAGSNPRPIRSDRDRPLTWISDRNEVPMVAMGPFRSPLRPGWVTGSALLSGGCAAHARSSGARRVAELRPPFGRSVVAGAQFREGKQVEEQPHGRAHARSLHGFRGRASHQSA